MADREGGARDHGRAGAGLRFSSIFLVHDAVRAGAGAALLPRSLVAQDVASGRLASWGELVDHAVEIWVLHASRRLASRKVTAFVEFLTAFLKA